MRAFGTTSAGMVTIAALFAGCAQVGPPDEWTWQAADIVENGVHLNGLHLNGLHLNGLHLNGVHLNGLHLNGLHLNGTSLAGASFTATTSDGTLLGPGDLLGAQMAATLSDGTSITLRIDAVTPSSDPEITRYEVSYAAPGEAFQPLCGTDDTGAPIEAIPLAGTWDESEGTPTGGSHIDDPSLFTFACEGFALAKCVELGYAPFRSVTECLSPNQCHVLSLTPFHQACTRMLRADYCGDGTSTTRDGTPVDVWDAQGIQTDSETGWTFEAEWAPYGAACVLSTRWPTIDESRRVADYIQGRCASRWQSAGCGGPSSTFMPANGFALSPSVRTLLRSRISVGP